MAINHFLEENLIGKNKDHIDSHLYNYYLKEFNSFTTYGKAKESILDGVDIKWRHLLEDCFKCFDLECYKVAIPTLISIVEGEISLIANSNFVGKRLLEVWESDLDTEGEKFDAIALYSILYFLKNKLFIRKDFGEIRPIIINRHWVLHGRDNPDSWSLGDYYRLINTLSSLQFIKEILKR